MTKFSSLLFLSIALFLNQSCIPLAVVGGGALLGSGTKLAVQDKTVGESVTDSTIWTKVSAFLVSKEIRKDSASNMSAIVHKGTVLLMGCTSSIDWLNESLIKCWQTKGVSEVINEVHVDPTCKFSTSQDLLDRWITAKIKMSMLATTGIDSTNYAVGTYDSEVFMLGTSNNDIQMQSAIKAVLSISRVAKLSSYLKVKTDLQKRLSSTQGKSIPLKATSTPKPVVYYPNSTKGLSSQSGSVPEPMRAALLDKDMPNASPMVHRGSTESDEEEKAIASIYH